MTEEGAFWEQWDALVAGSEVVIERAQHSAHPRYPEYIYPYDYGYLKDTTSADGADIDVWQIDGSKEVTGIIVTLDLAKKDSEVKVLLGVSDDQFSDILSCHRRGDMKALLVKRVTKAG